MTSIVHLDGGYGEGGGQILRTALALSMCLRRPVHFFNLRARRPRPGLRPQHLACVLAAADISGAKVQGATLGSQQLYFEPGPPRPGRYTFDIGTAGSTTLLLQTLLFPLLFTGGSSQLTLKGGTHNPKAPPFDFLARAFLPLLCRMGAKVALSLKRPGFYPQGGGIVEATIEPVTRLVPLDLLKRGRVLEIRACALVAGLPRAIAERELKVLAHGLALPASALSIAELKDCGIGNVITATVRCEHVTEVFSGFGERGLRAETVAARLAAEVKDYLAAQVPIGPYLADQLLVPLALAGGGSFLTTPPTLHTTTNLWVIQQFLPLRFTTKPQTPTCWRIYLNYQ